MTAAFNPPFCEHETQILVLNSGSSSLKFGLYTHSNGEETATLDGLADGIGTGHGELTLRDASGNILRSEKQKLASMHDAFAQVADWLREHLPQGPAAVGHRVVHGGPNLTTHQPLTPEVLDELKRCVHFAPLHLPSAMELIEAAQQMYPNVPQFACFDTAFHRNLPLSTKQFPLPKALFDEGVRRYGFHGLSYESIVYQLANHLPPRVVMAHLGSGASLAAVLNGQSVDTSMGLTPTGGIPMATRSGELDPGILLYLLRAKQMSVDDLEKLLNHEAGLYALSNGTKDMRDLEEAAQKDDAAAALAIEVFCTSIAKFVAAYASVLDGLDMLVFSGGIGEHSALVRQTVCAKLAFIGIALDEEANRSHRSVLSPQGNDIAVRIVSSQEDVQIARHCRTLMGPAD